jgi:hypothetical protein
MPRNAQFFDRSGRRISEAEAHDERGIIRDGVISRVPMTMADAAGPRLHFPRQHQHFTDAREFWDHAKDSLLVVDARRVGGVEGNRPGFRLLDNDFGRAAKDSAYREHERYLNDAWKGSEPAPTGAGERGVVGPSDDNDYADARRAESRSIEQIAQDHQRNMQRLYDAYARELENAWRANK